MCKLNGEWKWLNLKEVGYGQIIWNNGKSLEGFQAVKDMIYFAFKR